MARIIPDFTHESTAYGAGAARVVGIDEVGRGPLAGPVVAAAVVLDAANLPEGLRDSKRLGADTRERLAKWLHANASVAMAQASVEEIDRLNILRASHLAMTRAVTMLGADLALIDGPLVPADLPCPGRALVRGDAHCLSIAAASVVAKVARDHLMAGLARDFPGYGWERNMGYPTAEHRKGLLDPGVTPHHRRSFAPIHKMLYEDLPTNT